MKTLYLIFTGLAGVSSLLGHENHHHHHDGSEPLHRISIQGHSPLDRQIRQLQNRLEEAPGKSALIENLGWLFVSKARTVSDHGFYLYAARCAEMLKNSEDMPLQGRLMLGHIYLQEHRFAEAKRVAQELVKERGWHYDHGLLGDVLLDLGQTEGAIASYEEMMRQRPSLQSFARAALIRWQRGQLEGAIEAMEMAVSAGSLRSPEPLVWAYTKLAGYYLQKAEYAQVDRISREALRLIPGYPHAELVRGRGLMAQEEHEQALPWLIKAAQTLPEPAFLWALRDCLHVLGDEKESAAVETRLHETGKHLDPRTYALFLTTTGQQVSAAVGLCREEIKKRQDILTHDALAWALFAQGDHAEARAEMRKALGEGTRDPRLSLHAGIIACQAGDSETALRHLADAERDQALLFPSELDLLNQAREQCAAGS